MTAKLVEYITEITNIYFTLYDKNVKYTGIFSKRMIVHGWSLKGTKLLD